MATTDLLIAAERAFASAAAKEGTRGAFLQFLAEDSILFRPQPVDGLTWFEGQPANPGLLSWRPALAEMAASNDLGYTTGPWNFRSDKTGEPVQYGQYVSVWRNTRDSLWKVAVDVGITFPPPMREDEPSPMISIHHDLVRKSVSYLALLKVEAVLTEKVRTQGYLASIQEMAAANVWVLRMGQLPIRGLLAVAETLPAQPIPMEWEIAGAVASASGDLGYVYGTSRRIHADKSEEMGSFLRIWRWVKQDRWELALDIENPY